MSDIRDFNVQANDGNAREHELQLDLLHKLCQAIDQGENAATVESLLTDLIDYSEAHFMSEELLMRMKSYPDYEDHLQDHVHMLDVLTGLASNLKVGKSALLAGKAHEVLGFIKLHIATRDSRLANYVRTGQ